MAKTDIWMPIYIGDYLRDTMSLTTEQHGAYLLLLMECWMNGHLSSDQDELAAVTRLPLDRWQKIEARLSRFFVIEGGTWRQKRVEQEKEKADTRRGASSQNGLLGGRPKGSKKTQKEPRRNLDRTQTEPRANLQKSSSPSPSQSNKTSPNGEVTSPAGTASEVVKSDGGSVSHTPFTQIVAAYHSECPDLPRVHVLNAARKNSMRLMHKGPVMESDLANWEGYFRRVSSTDFLMGRVKDWRADFDFLMKAKTAIKVLEGGYSR